MWLSLTATFLWNFTDLFIMLVSSALAAQFKKLTKSMHSVRGQMLTMSQWREYRETYTSLTHLVKKIDDHINVIVALSIGSNIYFICAQLITEIDSIKHSYFRTLFYMYSFIFLVFRTTAVVMQASAINDESKKIVPEIFMCPTHSYSIEV
ncbi:PREDICTED: gustatory receptor for sugar taste 64f-like [Diuraphis noxia]|uniref:gustatory receptor for sugar taste 64f-like n=1 Tax=Diuraphis noxia TaxID=143948 RepID=UPI000763857E|nr:PREDICTED: gustatory receptor for sugar taste 64f-like [Diuraphis noxia]